MMIQMSSSVLLGKVLLLFGASRFFALFSSSGECFRNCFGCFVTVFVELFFLSIFCALPFVLLVSFETDYGSSMKHFDFQFGRLKAGHRIELRIKLKNHQSKS